MAVARCDFESDDLKSVACLECPRERHRRDWSLVSLNDVADGSVMVFIVDSSRFSRGAFLLERAITCHVEPADYRGSRVAPVSSRSAN